MSVTIPPPAAKPVQKPLPPPPSLEDESRRRRVWAIGISVLVNILFLAGAATMAYQEHRAKQRQIEITRIIEEKRKRTPPPPVIKRPKPVVPPKQAKAPAPPKRTPVAPRRQTPKAAQRPQSAHNRVLLAKGSGGSTGKTGDFTALAGGNARAGVPLAEQGTGNDKKNQPATPTTTPNPNPPDDTPKPMPDPAPQNADPAPAPTPPVEPTGATQEAEAAEQINPDIPEGLRQGDFQGSVRVRVDVAADGSFTPTLLSSSGNSDLDKNVLGALKRWKWKPSLRDGVPVASTKLFKFEFAVQ